MKRLILLILSALAFTPTVHADTDREEIKEAMECFYKWDLYGGKENSSRCIADNVLYHRVDQDGKHAYSTPKLDGTSGKGEGALKHKLVDINIYNDMAVVTSLHLYQPESPRNTYMKHLVLYKLADGWRVSSVSWGRVTNSQ
ncbi:MAG: hypothetical protein AB8G18_13345 [Gammaproteobacteria bacterium]